MLDWDTFLNHKAEVQAFFDPATNTISYVVADTQEKICIVIDSVLDFNPDTHEVTYESADAIIHYIESKKYSVAWILETHVHADHISAAHYLKEKLGGKTGISKRIVDVQCTFADFFGEGEEFKRDGSQFDHLFKDGESFIVGNIPAYALHTPGHTPADLAYIIGDSVFVGDTLFMPDFGSARCDFPGGSPEALYTSVQRIYMLPDTMRMFMCHDYLPQGRTEYIWETTVGLQRKENIHLKEGTDPNRFIAMRTERDATLGMPKLIIPSLQVNIRAGAIPVHPETKKIHLKKIDSSRLKK